MKVICIDAAARPDADNTFLSLLSEGKVYTIEGYYEIGGEPCSYYFYEIPGCFPHSEWRIAYLVARFIPVSDIDESKTNEKANNPFRYCKI